MSIFDEIETLIKVFKGRLPDDIINDYLHLYKEEGWLILEWLCDTLGDYQVQLSKDEYDAIMKLLAEYGMDAEVNGFLKKQVI